MRTAHALADVTPLRSVAAAAAAAADTKRLPNALLPDEEQPLLPREARVEALIVRGLQNKEIARHLGLSELTVRAYARDLYRKRGVCSRYELMARHYRGEIVAAPLPAPPSPPPVRLADQPCVVVLDGALVSGTCTGTFTPSHP